MVMMNSYLLTYLSKRLAWATSPATWRKQLITKRIQHVEELERMKHVRLGMRNKWERTRENDTVLRPPHHVGGDSAHLTRFAFQLEQCNALLLLTFAGVQSDAMLTQQHSTTLCGVDACACR